MRQYSVSVRLGGSTQQVVTGKIVTIPEIAVLRALHGSDAIVDVCPAPKEIREIARTDAEERDRLKRRYDHPTPDAEPLVDKLFGGPLGRLPTKLAEIGIDPRAEADALRARAEAMSASATVLDEEGEAPADEDSDVDVDDVFEKAS